MSVEELRQESIGERDDNNDGESLLTFAIMQPKLLRVLLEKGLNPNRQNAFGKTPLMYAAQFNSLEAIKILLEHGALTELTTVSSIDTCNYTIQTKNVSALHYAVRYSSGDIIKLLLDYGAPTYIADSNGHTPYDYLIKFGGIEEYMQPKKVSYGDLNQLLTDDDRRSLKLVLLPPEDDKKIVLSLKENLNAEKLYQQGKLQEAYRSLRRAISLNPNNERARANMSLVALKLGKLGESARVSTSLIETAKSDTEKANAYFNQDLRVKRLG